MPRNMLTGIPNARVQPHKPQIQNLLPNSVNGAVIQDRSIRLSCLSESVEKKIINPLENIFINEDNLSKELLDKINTEINEFKLEDYIICENHLSKDLLEKINNNDNIGEQIIQRIEIPLNDKSILENHLSNNLLDKINKDFSIENNSITTEKLQDECITAEKISEGCITSMQLDNNCITNLELSPECITKDKLSKEVKKMFDDMNNKIKSLDKQVKDLKKKINETSS
jgi:hypothetical protein